MAYVDGYMLALEDVLRDLKELQKPPGVDHGRFHDGHCKALKETRRKVVESLQSAKRTMRVLQGLEEKDDGASDPAVSGAGEPGR